jgi:hypothetical protein
LTLNKGAPEANSIHNSKAWTDPIAGLDAKFRFGHSAFYASGLAGVGGGGSGSDRFYDLSGHLGYQFSDSVVLSIGYRLFDVDYDKNRFVYDIRQQGWVLGMMWVLGESDLSSRH